MSKCAHVCVCTVCGEAVVCACVSVCVHMHSMALHDESARAAGG